jgi:hypothetical protein
MARTYSLKVINCRVKCIFVGNASISLVFSRHSQSGVVSKSRLDKSMKDFAAGSLAACRR